MSTTTQRPHPVGGNIIPFMRPMRVARTGLARKPKSRMELVFNIAPLLSGKQLEIWIELGATFAGIQLVEGELLTPP